MGEDVTRWRMIILALVAIFAATSAAAAEQFGSWSTGTSKDRLDDAITTWLFVDGTRDFEGWLVRKTPRLYVLCSNAKVKITLDAGMSAAGGTTPVSYRIDREPPKREAWWNSNDGTALIKSEASAMLRQMLGKTELYLEIEPFNASWTHTVFSLIALPRAIESVGSACGAINN